MNQNDTDPLGRYERPIWQDDLRTYVGERAARDVEMYAVPNFALTNNNIYAAVVDCIHEVGHEDL